MSFLLSIFLKNTWKQQSSGILEKESSNWLMPWKELAFKAYCTVKKEVAQTLVPDSDLLSRSDVRDTDETIKDKQHEALVMALLTVALQKKELSYYPINGPSIS
jgi:hypothetical protein